MKFVIDNWLLLLVAFTSGAMLLWPAVGRGPRAGSVPPNVAVQMINREKAVVVDVSEAEEFAAGHVVGSKNVPVNQLEQRLPEVVKNRTVPLILVCPNGARAYRCLDTARKLGYDKAVALAGGLNAWREASLPLEKA